MTWYLVDASAFITLTDIDQIQLIRDLDGSIYLPDVVADEIDSDPAKRRIREQEGGPRKINVNWISILQVSEGSESEVGTFRDTTVDQNHFRRAADHLGEDHTAGDTTGDVSLLGAALGMQEAESAEEVVVITDDKPLRKTCKALGISISGSIGIVIAAVERGDLEPDEAKDALVAMDEVGARLSARLLRKAERLIDEAAEQFEE